jgi:hypothetical protein
MRLTLSVLLLAWPATSLAQEIKFIDIISVQQRTELRHPPAPPPDCKDGNCVGGVIGSGSVGDGAPDQRDPRALGVYLLQVTPTEIRVSEPFEAEFRVVNTGRVSIEVPVYPHLSDLQPSDESVAFSYFSLALVVTGESEQSNVPALGYIMLYGSHEHEGSMMELKPGEWIRVRTTMKLHTWPSEPIFARLRGGFWLRKNTYRPVPGSAFTDTQNLYPNTTSTPPVAVHFLGATSSEDSKH